MKALQDHCRHHREAIYLKLKHASYTIDWLAKNIEPPQSDQHAQTLVSNPELAAWAAAHQLLRQNPRNQKNNTGQMTLGL